MALYLFTFTKPDRQMELHEVRPDLRMTQPRPARNSAPAAVLIFSEILLLMQIIVIVIIEFVNAFFFKFQESEPSLRGDPPADLSIGIKSRNKISLTLQTAIDLPDVFDCEAVGVAHNSLHLFFRLSLLTLFSSSFALAALRNQCP
jgi:hypothetical protein